jgi:uncharacterized protein YkwD
MARMHAHFMAEACDAVAGFENPEELKDLLNCVKAGENDKSGDSLAILHSASMADQACRENILSPFFNEIGVGVSKGQDGKLYMCQLFRQV